VTAPTPPSPETLQFLLLLERFGRTRLRALWASQGSLAATDSRTAANAADSPSPPAALTGALAQLPILFRRVRAATGLRPARLPWQELGDQLAQWSINPLLGNDLPAPLRAIPDPPLALYTTGNLARLREPAVAIVGARQATPRAQRWTEATAQALAGAGVVVISGLAFGIDAAAHRGALPRTVAVLGSGLRVCAPRANLGLFKRILDAGGCAVSEYSLLSQPRKYHFPERNRIISGLSRVVVVAEAGPRSGSLISARLALEQGRDVLAVPGPVGLPGSVGCHRLIKQGAGLAEDVDDVLQALGLPPRPDSPSPGPADSAGLSATGRRVLNLIDGCLTPTAVLAARSGLEAVTLAATLAELELGGFVHRQGEGYIRAP
jgi:DNA processing protein